MALAARKQIFQIFRLPKIAQYSFSSHVSNKNTNTETGPKFKIPELDKKEWTNRFALFSRGGTSDITDVRLFINSIDFSFPGLKKFYKAYREEKHLITQIFNPKRLEFLGPNLAAAHFVVFRNGKVKFQGHDRWIEKDEDEDDLNLPRNFDPNYIVEHIDMSNTAILYEGLENIKLLDSLKSLNVSNCKRIDDWCLDRIAGEFRDCLEELDVSGCDLLTDKGLAGLSKLKKLRKLKISKYPKAQNLELTCLLLEEAIPGLEISGFDYCDEKLLEKLINQNLDQTKKD